jgi:subtilisin family serine protease
MDLFVEPNEHIVGGDLVVDLPYCEPVEHALSALDPPVQVTAVYPSEKLGLALLSLEGVKAYAEAHPPPEPKVDDLNAVLYAVRDHFIRRCGGWVPEMGKNRYLRGVIGLPQSKPLEGGAPDDATGAEYRPSSDSTAGRGVRVGVLDTGFARHPALAGHVEVSDVDRFEPGTFRLPIWAGHATFVAGLIAAQAPGAQIVLGKVLDNLTGQAPVWETAVAMAAFADRGVDVLNLSLGCRTLDGRPPLVLRRAVEVLGPRMVIVAAAGNHGNTDNTDDRRRPIWPAALPGVLAVGAMEDHQLVPGVQPTVADISPRLPWVDCIAPGIDLVSTYVTATVLVHPDQQYPTHHFTGFARWRGTSFAAATVSGAIAARTVPGQVSAQDALRYLLDTPNPVVSRYLWRDDCQCA